MEGRFYPLPRLVERGQPFADGLPRVGPETVRPERRLEEGARGLLLALLRERRCLADLGVGEDPVLVGPRVRVEAAPRHRIEALDRDVVARDLPGLDDLDRL